MSVDKYVLRNSTLQLMKTEIQSRVPDPFILGTSETGQLLEIPGIYSHHSHLSASKLFSD